MPNFNHKVVMIVWRQSALNWPTKIPKEFYKKGFPAAASDITLCNSHCIITTRFKVSATELQLIIASLFKVYAIRCLASRTKKAS